jgi:hypothetical protein
MRPPAEGNLVKAQLLLRRAREVRATSMVRILETLSASCRRWDPRPDRRHCSIQGWLSWLENPPGAGVERSEALETNGLQDSCNVMTIPAQERFDFSFPGPISGRLAIAGAIPG